MNRAEEMTRMAATAFGYDLAGHVWFEKALGFFDPAQPIRNFCPLSNKAQAYELEDKLRMEVMYRTGHSASNGPYIVISVRTFGHGGAVMHTVRDGESTITERMYAVTQFAALHSVMEDMPHVQQQR